MTETTPETTTPETTSPGTTPSDDVFRLIYRSRNRIDPDQRKAELGALFSTARSNNKKDAISGALLLSHDWFVQVLEGDESAVRTVFSRIETDHRHDTVTILHTGPAPRVFAKWAMAMVSRDEDGPDIPLIAHADGAHRAARSRTTPEQEEILARMRDAARDTRSA